jgi:hypothetical protein
MKLVVLLVVVIMAEALLHYIPWRKILRGEELPRLAAYTLGLLGMMVPLSVWLWDSNECAVMQILWAVIASAGITVFALYGFDRYLDLIMRDIEATEREKLRNDGKKG